MMLPLTQGRHFSLLTVCGVPVRAHPYVNIVALFSREGHTARKGNT